MRRTGNPLRVRSYRRPGRLLPHRAKGLHAGAVALKAGGVMDWHSTRTREELLIAVSGRVHVEVQLPTYPSRRSRRANRCIVLQAGQCALLPRQTVHRVVNRSAATSRYLYVTGPSRP